jgi:hypothetical protein
MGIGTSTGDVPILREKSGRRLSEKQVLRACGAAHNVEKAGPSRLRRSSQCRKSRSFAPSAQITILKKQVLRAFGAQDDKPSVS